MDKEKIITKIRERGLVAPRSFGKADPYAFETEPPANPAWFSLDNIVIGSHCAASTVEATGQMGRMATKNLMRDLGGE